MDIPAISIVICTHNPRPVLREVLHALAAQDGTERAEILVIDNASTPPVALPDGMRARLIRESRLGLSAARNRGIGEARSDLIAFLDDDAIPGPGWLAAMLQAAADHPQAGAFGGRVDAVLALPLPGWMTDAHLLYFGAFDRGDAYAPLAYPDFPRGCNMLLRRSALPEHPFHEAFGKRGKRQACYEEIDLCWRLEQAGLPSVYVPGAQVRHVMGGERFTQAWFAERVFEQGKAVRLFERRHAVPDASRMLRSPIRAALKGDTMNRRLALGYLWGSVLPAGRAG